jgi:hypothetical protein
MEGYPMRSWSIEVWLLDDQGNEYMPNVFEKATYNLHPTFPNPRQSKSCVECLVHERWALTCRSIQEAAVPHRREGLGRV